MTYHILNVPLRVLGVVVGLGLSGVGWGQTLDAVDDTGATDSNTPITVSAAAGLLANDVGSSRTIDEVGETAITLAATNVGMPTRGEFGGQFTVSADGSYTFDPNGNFGHVPIGSTTSTQFHYQLTDGTNTDTAVLVITVTGAAPPPDFGAETVNDQIYIRGLRIDNLTLPEATGDGVTYALTGRLNGLAFATSTRILSGTPLMDQVNVLTYTATNTGGMEMLTFSVTVAPANVAIGGVNHPDMHTLTVQEGATEPYSVVLNVPPTGDVTITPNWVGDAAAIAAANTVATFSPAALVFTTANWNTPQSVTVTGVTDADTIADDAVTLTHTPVGGGYGPETGSTLDPGSGEPGMTGVVTDPAMIPDVVVTVTESDPPGVTISEMTLPVTEGASGTYTVVLDSAPSGGNVTVTPRSDDMAVATVSPAGGLVFTAGNWDDMQTVIVSGADDADTDNDTTTITHEVVGGGNYAGVTTAADVTVTVTDSNAPGVTISSATVGITEGASGFYTVVLATVPSGNVTVTPRSGNLGVATVSGALTFTAGDYDTPQTVTVSGVEDANTATDTANITHTVVGANYNDAPVTPEVVTVTVTDNNTPAPAPTPATAEDEVNRVILPDVTREMSDRQMGAIARRMGQARSGDGGGEYSSAAFSASASAWAAEAMRSGVDGGFDGKAMLGASDFVLPLGASGGGGALGESAAMWGNGDFSQLGGETRKIDWDGDLLSVNAGVDAHLGDELLGGVMLSWNEADIGYTDDTTADRERGDYDLDMFSIHPYIGNSTPDGRLDWWATLGFGNGDLVIRNKTNNTRSSSDVSMHMVGIGGNNRLRVRGDNELRLKAEVFATGADVKGGKAADMVRLSALDVNTQRMRVALQARRPHTLPGGANLTLEVEGGMRYDGGDGETGSGVEVGSAVRYADLARGLTWGLHTRALLYHGGDYEDFGIGGDVQLNAGADGQGLSLSLAPAYGNTGGGGVDEVWQGGLPAVGADAADLQASLNTRVGYGLPSAAFMLTPYGEMALGEEVQNYRLGLSWGVGTLFDLNLVGERAEKDGVGAEHAVWFEGRVRF